jgi:hypothetical protein
MKALTWIKFVTPLALIAAIVFGLRSCAGNVTGDLTQIAEINSPQSQAAGNTARLMGEVQARAESDRQAILAAGQAQLELERAKALQDQTLAQQAQAQQAEHAARLAEINAQEAAQLAAIDAKKAEQLAAIDTQRIDTAAEWAIKIVGVIGLVAVAIIATLTLWRLARLVCGEARARRGDPPDAKLRSAYFDAARVCGDRRWAANVSRSQRGGEHGTRRTDESRYRPRALHGCPELDRRASNQRAQRSNHIAYVRE